MTGRSPRQAPARGAPRPRRAGAAVADAPQGGPLAHLRARRRLPLAAVLALVACDGPQSALAPAGEDAATLLHLFWVMLAGAVVVWLLVTGLFFYLTQIDRRGMNPRLAGPLIVGGGIVLPVLVVGSLLVWGLRLMPEARAPGEGLRLRVTAEQWWWRVEYWPEGAATPLIAANEIRLPAGRRSEIELGAARVIHSFWVPALGGKLDMFPGRLTRTSLAPTRPGLYRGQCAEFCGLSHALMAFPVVVMEPAEFDRWLAAEAAPPAPPATPAARRGEAVFRREGCGACHAVRGTPAAGNVGPDLSHVGSRHAIAAGTLPARAEDFARFIADPQAIKPGVEMPAYGFLPEAELAALGAYLEGLK